ncbi:MalY/PatB family protein [Schnuerera sp.]|uniref:MalY/PatB family protein n=1 Tax=Schnuerera sp. TaxID=2794844 RepID=UPI002B90CDEE|nr:MalY/PatB family protein [Schnuerera sp.]HSH36201.1 MalY/PatB family protein [Schnuerera sp.]
MKYNFDQIINRENTNSTKWDPDTLKEMFGTSDILPFWVADMDFKVADPIVDAVVKRAEHGIYGYATRTDSYFDAIINWTRNRFKWDIEKEWIEYTPGVVPAINFILQAFTKPGDKVLIQEPVYYPFKRSINNNNLKVVNSPLKYDGEKYEIDFVDLEEKIKDQDIKIFILCNPHNPVGKVWDKEDLIKIGNLCLENDVLVVSDEIHNDLVYSGNTHTMFASISEKFAMNSITCTAPSKTFNLAGMQASNIIIPNPKLMEEYRQVLEKHNISGQNPLSIVALEAAYNYGEEWLEELLIYLEGNIEFIFNYLIEHLPKAKFIKPEGTYLAWVDLREYEMNGERLEKTIIEKGKVAFDGGTWFGENGEGFIRINFACPRSLLEEGLSRLVNAVNRL